MKHMRPLSRFLHAIAALGMLASAGIWTVAVVYGLNHGAGWYDISAGVALVIGSLFCTAIAAYAAITGRYQ